MVFLILMGLVLVAVSARLLIYAVVLPRIKLAVHLREIEAYGFEAWPRGRRRRSPRVWPSYWLPWPSAPDRW